MELVDRSLPMSCRFSSLPLYIGIITQVDGSPQTPMGQTAFHARLNAFSIIYKYTHVPVRTYYYVISQRAHFIPSF